MGAETFLLGKAKHCNLLTRRALFTVQSPDLEYDEAVVCKKEADWSRDHSGCIVPDSHACDRTVEKHRLIDKLAEKPAAAPRQDDDSVNPALLNGAKDSVKKAASCVALLANKFVAHAATD